MVWVDYIFIHSSVDLCLGCFHFLAMMNNAAMNICLHVFMLTYIFEVLPVFFIEATPFYIPISNVWGFWFLYILSSTWYWPSFNYSHPSRCEVVCVYVCFLIVVLVYISSMAMMLSLFSCLLDICRSLKYLFISFPHLKNCLSFYYWVLNIFVYSKCKAFIRDRIYEYFLILSFLFISLMVACSTDF